MTSDDTKAESWSEHLDDLIDERNDAQAAVRRWKRICRRLILRYKGRLDSANARADTYKDTIQTMIDSAHSAIGMIVVEEEEAPYVYDKEKN